MVKSKPLLPKIIRDELRMTVALQGYSHLIQGKGRTIKSQYDQMFIFYHGQKPNRPSQIKLLCDGAASYRDMYESSQSAVTSKSPDLSSTSILTLKSSLTLDLNVNYRCGQEIVLSDLERKTINDPLLVTGRSLHGLAKKGVTFYRKALSYAVKKWDLKKNEPTESGTSVADIIEFVRRQMYKDINDIEGDDSVEEEEDFNEVDEEKDAQSDDNEKDDTNSGNDEEDNNQAEASLNTPTKSASKPSYINQIPNDWFFPGFMSFVVYGPFVDANDRLACFETSDGSTESNRGRVAKRKAEISEKSDDRLHDNSNPRGYTTDQMFTSEALRLQRLAYEQTANESNLMALIAHETSLGRQIDAAERRAILRCAEYNPENIYWQRCDTLIEQQSKLNLNIASFTKDVKPVSIEDAINKEAKVSQNDVVILPSSSDDDSLFGLDSLTPTKKKKVSNSK